MAFDFVSEVDKKFFSDNLLLNEDWDNIDLSPVEDVSDFVSLFDVNTAVSAEDFMRSLPDELELPILENDDVLMQDKSSEVIGLHSDVVRDLSDSSDSGLDCGSTTSTVLVKDEPLSPASSFSSETQQDAISNTQILMETNVSAPTTFTGLPLDLKLESPPLTPERDTHSDLTGVTFNTEPTQGVKIDFYNTQVLNTASNSLQLGTNVISGSNVIPAKPSVLSPNVTQVLNKKVKIQPKPVAPVQTQTQAQLPAPSPGKPLVLTPEQFAKLTSQGVLKFHNPLDQSQPATVSCPQPRSPLATEGTTSISMTTDVGTIHEKLAKRQQRMIKNRESACLSRKRKKEYLSTMEKKLQDSVDENRRLREQNERLKKCVQSLQSENEQLKSVFHVGGPVKKATCVMAILFLVSLNLGPLTNNLFGSHTKQRISPVSENFVHHGRALMSFNENATEELPSVDRHSYLEPLPNLKSINAALEGLKQRYASSAGPTSNDLMVVKALEEINVPVSMCPSYFNSSESQRLMKELTGWVLGHKAGLKAAADLRHARQGKHAQQNQQETERPHHRKKYNPPRKLKAALRGAYAGKGPVYNGPSAAYEVQLFTGSDRRYEDFFQAVQIRNDTFYVVSFRRDHLLLPATAHNKTMRPRMSLLMPAQPINPENDTAEPRADNIAMMQIDCEVTATKLLHVSKASIPQNVDELSKNNQTSPPSVDRERQRKKWQQNQKWRRKP